MARICIVPQVSGVGGMVSFRARFTAGLAQRGIQVCSSLSDTPYDAVLVIGGTRDLIGLRQVRRRGVRIVQRLNGMNWIQRKRRTGLKHALRAEYGNLILNTIRTRLAHRIVYQSRFAQGWWERVYGPTQTKWKVVYNAVDLGQYSPLGPEERPADRQRLLLVEGSLGGGYEGGLDTAIQMAEILRIDYGMALELMVVGKVSSDLQAAAHSKTQIPLVFSGKIPGEHIPQVDRSAHLLFAADINAACPNSTIEALACGLPVVAFDTGALPELVTGDAGRVVGYGGNPWELDAPDVAGLAGGAAEILADQPRFRQGARRRAEEAFGLDTLVEGYLECLLG
jgi:glycosyltransferase involved in cell wall biosynthesis